MELVKWCIKSLLMRTPIRKKAVVNIMVINSILLYFKFKMLFIGHWENGQKHGEGIFTYLNRDVYSGWWKYGIKHGKGTYIY